MKNTTLILLIVLSVFSCKQKNTKNSEIVNIDFSSQKSISFFDNEVFKSVDYTLLEANEGAMLGNKPKLILQNNIYYIYDRDKYYVTLFDLTGKFINKVGVVGRGPGEYVLSEDFLVDKKTNNVEIISLQNEMIYQYKSDGTFIDTLYTGTYAFSFTKDDDGNYWICKGPYGEENDIKGKEQIYKINGKGELLKKYLPIDNIAFRNPMPEESLTEVNGNLFFKIWFDNTVYRISDNGAEPVAIFDFKERSITKDILMTPPEQFINKLMEKEFLTIQKYLENDDYIYAGIENGDVTKFYHYLFNKKTSKAVFYEMNKDNTFRMGLGTAKILTDKNELIFIGDPVILNELINSGNNLFSSAKEIPAMDEKSNNVIVKLKIRD